MVAVNNVSMQIREQEIVGIVGESGCGKSMTAFSILGIVPHPGRVESGHIIFNGKDLLSMRYRNMRRLRGSAISLVYQDPLSSLNPSFPVLWHFGEVLRAHGKRTSPRQTARIAVESLQKVKIPSPEDKIHQYPHQLSGGMRQRIVIALSLRLKPRIIIADEPTTALDVTTQKEIFNLIERLKSELGIAFVYVTHDLASARYVGDFVMVMYAGQIVESGTAQQTVFDPLHPYAKGLMGSIIVPESGLRGVKLAAIQGVPPNLKNPPPGCRFAPRCKYVQPECVHRSFDLRDAGGGRAYRCIMSVEQIKKAYKNG